MGFKNGALMSIQAGMDVEHIGCTTSNKGAQANYAADGPPE